MGIEMPHFAKQATGPKVRLPSDGSGAALILALLALASSAGVAVLTDDLFLTLLAFAPISLALLVLYAGVRRIFGPVGHIIDQKKRVDLRQAQEKQ